MSDEQTVTGLNVDDPAGQLTKLVEFLMGRPGFAPQPNDTLAADFAVRMIDALDARGEQFDEIMRQYCGETCTPASLAQLLGTMSSDLKEARALASAHKGQATRARNDARVLRLEKSPTRRKCGPLPAADGDADVLARREAIRSAIYEGDHVDVVASDGKKALIEIAPERVNGDAWRERPDGFLLTSSIEHEPGEMDKPEIVIAGYGLFDVEGNQVGWRGLHDPIRVGSGQRVRVENSIIF